VIERQPRSRVIVERSMDPGWLSNGYLVCDGPGGHGVIVDTGAPMEPLLRSIEELGVEITHVLCTHHHPDHVAHNAEWSSKLGCPVLGSARERGLFDRLDGTLDDGEEVTSGSLRIRALSTPGHTPGMLAFVVGEQAVFTGDTLFRGSVGGTGGGSFDDLRRSIMDVLMRLPPAMQAWPGHSDPTTIGDEWERNPFVRAWRGLDSPGTTRCVAAGRPATLVVGARDYDGGRKCWVRFDDGRDAIVPGSRVHEDG
jgi:glyoxylase-like metal-dependent hydrolase (beta-lactamase superfamily II)